MPALWNRAGHYIFCPVVSFFFFLFFPHLIRCLPYLHTWRGPSASLECRSETWCTWLAENTVHKKNHHLGAITQLCPAHILVHFKSNVHLKVTGTILCAYIKHFYSDLCGWYMMNDDQMGLGWVYAFHPLLRWPQEIQFCLGSHQTLWTSRWQ